MTICKRCNGIALSGLVCGSCFASMEAEIVKLREENRQLIDGDEFCRQDMLVDDCIIHKRACETCSEIAAAKEGARVARADLEDLRDELEDARAPNMAKGKEAEELRAAIEKLIAEEWGDGSEDVGELEDWAKCRFQRILDEVDARDSLAYLEAPGIEPGTPIAKVQCPCCGASLEIEHGDDEGEISVIGTKKGT